MSVVPASHLLSALGPAGLACALIVLARLSRRMHDTTRGKPIYRWFYISAALLVISAGARVAGATADVSLDSSWEWVLLYNGLPTLAVLISLGAAWRIWAWLLAERD